MRKLLLTLLVVLTAACHNRQNNIPEPAPEGRWYQLLEGRLEAVSGPAAFLPADFQPWTVQARIADLAPLGEEIFLAINGYGLAALQIPVRSPEGVPRIRYFYDPTLFAHRTISTLIAEEDTLLCHLYFNKLLNDVGEENLLLQGISLVRHHPAEDVYELIIPPFQDRHPDWEAVGFLPQGRDRFLLEWKYTDERETRFHYGLLTLNPFAETDSDRDGFRGGFDFHSIDEAPPALGRLFSSAVRTLAAGEPGTSIHFLVRSPGNALLRRYAYTAGQEEDGTAPRLVTLHAVEDGESSRLLLPGGTLLESGFGNEAPRRRELPPLPPRFRYTDLFLNGSSLLLPWEQEAFIQVGAAGLYVCPAFSDAGG